MTAEEEEFQHDVSACVKALNEQLPQLAARHSGTVVLAAMSEHVGGALRILMQRGECTPERARQLLAELEAMVFSEFSAPLPEGHRSGAGKGK